MADHVTMKAVCGRDATAGVSFLLPIELSSFNLLVYMTTEDFGFEFQVLWTTRSKLGLGNPKVLTVGNILFEQRRCFAAFPTRLTSLVVSFLWIHGARTLQRCAVVNCLRFLQTVASSGAVETGSPKIITHVHVLRTHSLNVLWHEPRGALKRDRSCQKVLFKKLSGGIATISSPTRQTLPQGSWRLPQGRF
jgi:hypothetical protein